MGKLYTSKIKVGIHTKEISVYCDDITEFKTSIDVLTTSAFVGSYAPTPRTVFESLYKKGISVEDEALSPEIDLRKNHNVWLSQKLSLNKSKIKRIGCIELLKYSSNNNQHDLEQAILNSIQAYFQMLDDAVKLRVRMTTIALPLLGSGTQSISHKMLLTPLINECISFLERNKSVKKILFIERNYEKATLIADSLKQSLRFVGKEKHIEEPSLNKNNRELAFISYSSADKNIADNLCNKLENSGISVWYAPRDVSGPYAESIVNAIDKSTYFIVILSQNSIASEHVLNEIDLAFQKLPNKIKFKPLRIDNSVFTPSFRYYLSRQHWMDATCPPLERRLNEFVDSLLKN